MMQKSTLEPELMRLIRRRDWNPALHRVTSHPHEAHYSCKTSGFPVLFLSFFYQPPLALVEALVQAHPAALHYALDRNGAIVTTNSSSGCWTLLHHVAQYGDASLMEFVLQHCNNSLVADHKGELPLTVLAHSAFGRGMYHKDTSEEFRNDALDKAILLCKAMRDGSDHYEFMPLHELLYNSMYMGDLELIKYAIYKYPDELQKQNHDGNTPLHVACMVDPITNGCCGYSQDAIDLLVTAWPHAATIQNNKGQWPLTLALLHDKEMVESLVQAYPPAVLHPTTDASGLFPFMQAAMVVESSSSSSSAERLSSVYTLFRTCPELNRFCTIST